MNLNGLRQSPGKRLISVFFSTLRSILNRLFQPRRMLRLLLTGPSWSFPIARRHEQRFVAAAEANLDNFALLECKRNLDNAIVDLRYVYINRRGAQFMSMLPNQIIGEPISNICPLKCDNGVLAQLKHVVATSIPLVKEFSIVDNNGRDMWVYLEAVQVEDGVAVTWRDITKRKEQEQQLLSLAQTDSLTGLPNRALFRDRLEGAITRTKRNRSLMAVMYLDTDHFKNINDTLGHAAGDDLLREFGLRAKSCVRASDTVARLGGDEFTVILEGVNTEANAAKVAQNIVQAMQAEFFIANRHIEVSTSIGMALFDGEDDCTGDELLKRADIALYNVKHRGGNGYSTYAPLTESRLAKNKKTA